MEDGSWYVMNLYGEDDLLRDDLSGVSEDDVDMFGDDNIYC